MSDTPSIKGKVFSLFLGLLLTIAIAEIILRLLFPQWRDFDSGRFITTAEAPDNRTVVVGRAGFEGKFTQNNGDFSVKIKINEFGLRNDEPVGAADGQIWVVGDSMTFGWGVEADEMFSEVVQKELGRPVYNVASPGTDVCGYQSLVDRMPKTVRPQAIIVGLILENDMAEYDCAARANSKKPISTKIPSINLFNTKVFLTKKSAFYNFIAIGVKRVNVATEILISLGLVEKAHAYKRYFELDKIEDVARATAKELAVLRNSLPKSTPFGVIIAPGRFELRSGDEAYRRMRISAAKAIRETGISVIDPFDEFRLAGFAPTHFAHDGHWSVLGHQIAGKAAAKWLRSTLEIGDDAAPPVTTGP